MSDLREDLSALRIDRSTEPPPRRRWIGWALVLLLLAIAGAGAWRWFARERPVEVQVASVTMRAAGNQAAVLNASGYVTARRRATVSAKVTGKVVEMNVEEGMAVREGQILARLDDATPRAALALAEAQAEAAHRAIAENEVRLDEAIINLNRLTKLVDIGAATAAEVDAARANRDSTQARILALKQQAAVAERQVELQKAELDNMIVRAPFSGVAISKDAQPGEMVSPISAGGGFTRTGICTIVDMRSLEIEVDVNESYINRVRSGQDVVAVLDAYPDWQIPAEVITMVPTADRQKATVLVRIGFKALDPRILPDMGVKVTFLRSAEPGDEGQAKPAVLTPKASIREENGKPIVFVIRGDRVERRAIQTGGGDGDRVEVTAGLQNGDRVVIAPPPALQDGTLVTVQNP
ncbi:MAG: efflux RND transporter periplasmic adaptor subunit [Acidobacteria bacterium]|nr:efflux RND transporter periplasmic adaptor subunit [Acidobacteriota bacterium]